MLYTSVKGMLSVTFCTEADLEDAMFEWRNSSERHFTPQQHVGDTSEDKWIILQGVNPEYPLHVLREYLFKYFEGVEVCEMKYPGTRIGNGLVKVEYEKLKRKIGKWLYIGPNMSAQVKSKSHEAMGAFEVRCPRCFEEGHLAYRCKNEQRCGKCKGKGHGTRECPRCNHCNKNGHETLNCKRREEIEKEKTKVHKVVHTGDA